MTTFGLIVVFVMIWWIVLFMVLPIGVRPQQEVVPGTSASAPARPRILLRMAVTTIIAGILTWSVYLVFESELIQLRLPA